MALINKDRLIKTFMEMVSIGSESGNESRFASYMVSLGEELGLESKKDKYDNVYLSSSGGSGKPIMINTHMDTVSPGKNIKPRVKGDYITSSGDTVLGADSKAGIASMVEMVRVFSSEGASHRPFVITLTCNEESGIPTADKIVSEVKECVVPDRGTPVGEIVIEAPYAQVYEVEIKGKTVYAPTSYEDGVHAIDSAISMLSELPRGDIDKDTTVNIGIIKGGEMTSMVPYLCTFKGNCYSFSKNSLERFLNKLGSIVKNGDSAFGTKSKISMLEYFGGYKIKKTDPLVKEVESAIKSSGVAPRYKVYKAVTNANLLNQVGIKTVLISTGVENQHTVKERISIDSLVKNSEILVNLVSS